MLFMTYMNFFYDDLAKEKWNIHRTEQVMRCGSYPQEPVTGIELLNSFQEQDEFSVMVCMQMAKRSMIEEHQIRYIDDIILKMLRTLIKLFFIRNEQWPVTKLYFDVA